MEAVNHTTVSSFILIGLTSDPELQVPLFIVFLLIYIITVLDNIGIIAIYCIDPLLHTPMYFFISQLSFVDLCYSTTITPKMLWGFLVDKNVISFTGCALQFLFYSTLGIAESFIFSIMAFDRYTAICKPLHYKLIMTYRLCNQLAVVPYVSGLIAGLVYTMLTFRLSFCEDKIQHHFCNMLPLFKLSCEDISLNEIIVYTMISFMSSCNMIVLGFSYTRIIITILKIHSSTGRHRVFTTCSSHLICVILFYGPGLNMYLRPTTRRSDEMDKVIAVFYTVIISMLNPLIYCLRNKDVKAAFLRILKSKEALPKM